MTQARQRPVIIRRHILNNSKDRQAFNFSGLFANKSSVEQAIQTGLYLSV